MISVSVGAKCNPSRKKVVIAPGSTVVVDAVPEDYTNKAMYFISYEDTVTGDTKSSNVSLSWDDTRTCDSEYAITGKSPLTSTSTQLNASNMELIVENKGTNPICVLVTRTL